MALTLDATIGGVNANSYNTVARTTALLEETPFATAWAAATNQAECCVHGTTMIDVEFDWAGNKADLVTPQALEFPRVNLFIHDRGPVIASNIIPLEIERAAAHLAYHYSQQTAQPENSAGIEQVKTPAVEVKFKASQIRDTQAIPEYIRKMVHKFVRRTHSVGGSLRLERA